jgi:rhodanese-related sulfurtransferase
MVNIRNVLVILLISIFLAVVFNYFNPKGITWFPEPEKFVSDSLLTKNTTQSLESYNDNEFLSVNYKQVLSKLDDPEVIFIDARPVEEFEENRIGNAISCFPYIDEGEFMRIIFEEIPRDKIYIIYCHGGNCDLSHMVAERMKAFDFQDIFIYTAGWEEWSRMQGAN